MPRRVLLVTKPFGPPWRDSSKNLARDLATHGQRYVYRVLAREGAPLPDGPLEVEWLYRGAGHYQPGLAQNLRVALRLAGPARGVDLYHFLFAPHPRTALVARVALRARTRRRPTVHTVCSLPGWRALLAAGCFADRTVALSAWGESLLRAAGVPGVVRINPCVPVPAPVDQGARARARAALHLGDGPVVVFAGDVEEGHGASAVVAALPGISRRVPEARFVVACRRKTAQTRMAEREHMALVRGSGLADRTLFLGDTDRMEEALLAADLQLMPARTLERKMDYPLVLLEGFARGVPAIVGDAPSLLELCALEGGPCLHVHSDRPEALAEATVALLRDDRRRTQMGQAARRAVEERFSPGRMAAAYELLYDELLHP
jgi:glycosyltransferase involved in cell wall biosynthesis